TQPVQVTGQIGEAVVDSGGTMWVRVGSDVLQIARTAPKRTIRLADQGSSHLTLVGDQPVALTGDGHVVRIGPNGAKPVVTAPISADTPVQVAAPSDQGDVLWVVLGQSGKLEKIDLTSGKSETVPVDGIAGHSLGDPVTANGRVYLPDYGKHL